MTLHQLQQRPWRLLSSAASWHVTSQHRARRNALVASTALTQGRKERLEVEQFLTEYDARRAAHGTITAVVSHTA